MFVDHIAFLTADLIRQSNSLPDFCQKQEIESFPAEGTQEQYIQLPEHSTKLLLLQPIAEGPYARALDKRGPGLHHLGVSTQSIEALMPQLNQHSLFLHPISIQTIKQGTVWICRPGMPFLIEVFESDAPADHHAEPLEIALPANAQRPEFLSDLFLNLQLSLAATEQLELRINQQRLSLSLL